MPSPSRMLCAALTLAALCIPALASAQDAVDSFDQLRYVLQPGSDLRVFEPGGRTLKGTFDGFGEGSLALVIDGTRRLVRQEDILRIQQRHDDDLGNGARNGFIAGAALGLLAGVALGGEGGSAAALIPISIGVYGGIGAGIGVAVDALIRSERTVYDASRKRSSVAVAPVVTRARKGVTVTVGF